MDTAERRTVLGAWVSARLSRAKRILPFKRLWQDKHRKARVLPPDEAAKESARHQALVEQLAPETLVGKESSEG